MLTELGLPNRPLLARVRLGPPGADHPPRTHVLLLVEIAGEPWIADVGFGGSYLPPLPLRDGAEAGTPDGARYRLRRIDERGALTGEWLLERAGPPASTDGRGMPHADWQAQYSFDLDEVAPADLAQANHWTATAPGSRFTTVQIATIALPQGFASLLDHALSLVDGAAREQAEITDPNRYRAVLAERFRLELDEAEIAELPLFRAR
jgi:N-hydroxyarylamine O-acetyltransferase